MLSGYDAAEALRWTERLTGLAIAVGTLELLAIRRACADDGIWRWSALAPELPWLGVLLRYRPFLAVLGTQLCAAVLLMLGRGTGSMALLLWITSLLVCLRFRGTYNGGSDAMQMVLLSALVVAEADAARPALRTAALLYVAVQTTLSYVVAGIAKLANREWRDGRALQAFLQSRQYGVPMALQRLAPRRAMVGTATAGILIFECTMPAAWVHPAVGIVMIGLALCFHAGTVAMFGLNRFLLIWTATYPALLYAATGQWR